MGKTPVSLAQVTAPGSSQRATCLTDSLAGGQLRILPHKPLFLVLKTTVCEQMTTVGKTPEDGPEWTPRLCAL